MSYKVSNYKNTIEYKDHINGLRGVAIISVVLFHLDVSFFKGGFLGVDIFFVISGYLISSIIFKQIKQNTFDLKKFLINRLRRILPALLLVIISTIPFSYFLIPYKSVGFAESIISSIFFYLTIYTIGKVVIFQKLLN